MVECGQEPEQNNAANKHPEAMVTPGDTFHAIAQMSVTKPNVFH